MADHFTHARLDEQSRAQLRDANGDLWSVSFNPEFGPEIVLVARNVAAIDTADKLRDANPWKHEPDPVKLAVLGKAAEELSELIAAISRCIIQGVDGTHPVTGKPNIDWLWEEMVDVRNMLEVMGTVWLPPPGWHERLKKKRDHIDQWLKSITPQK